MTQLSNESKRKRDSLYIAALLHDIGKFYQRADLHGVKSSEQIDAFHKKLESSILPSFEGRYTHKHALWTAQFFEDFKFIFEENSNAFGNNIQERKKIVRWSAAHHNPNPASQEELLVQLADHLASGIDRTTPIGLMDDQAEYDYEKSNTWDKFKEVRMNSIFENLLKPKENSISYHFPVKPISLSKDFFPKNSFSTSGQTEYQSLWESFTQELYQIPLDDSRQLADSLLYLLEKYTVTIPSSTQHLPDVSLYDHLRSTAAFSICLHDYTQENTKKISELGPEEPLFLLIGGDISGIQNYIYDIVGKGAAKNLKGRSFYLQLMVDSIVDYVLSKLNLYPANIVYSSGGGFYILAPNTEYTRATIPKLMEEIRLKILEEHGTSLYIAMSTQTIQKKQVFSGKINDIWIELTKKLSEMKLNRFANFISTPSGYQYFFEPSDVGGKIERDAITGEEFKIGEKKYPFADIEDGIDLKIKKNTFEQIRLGKILRDKILYQIVTPKPIPYWENDYRFLGEKTDRFFNPLGLPRYYYFLSKEDLDDLKSKLKGSVDDAIILKVNDTRFLDLQIQGKRNVNGFTFYGGNDLPRQDEKALYYDQLAGGNEVSLKRLGILRMDVDSLGLIFKEGFADGNRTFSRYSSLSRSLDYFFKGYINTIWRHEDDFRDNTLILYAGGDDLFIIGKWDVTIRLAKKIKEDFGQWTCQNSALGISGGMAIVTSKFPIAKAAKLSEQEEKMAKNHVYGEEGIFEKKSFSFLNKPLSWEFDFPEIESLKDQLVRLIETEKVLSKSFLGKVASYHELKTEQELKSQNPSWRWISAYDLSRAAKMVESKEAKAFLENVKINLFTNKKSKDLAYDYLDMINLAARWAELEIRSN